MAAGYTTTFRLGGVIFELRTNAGQVVEFLRKYYAGSHTEGRPEVCVNLRWQRSWSRVFARPNLSDGWIQLGRRHFLRHTDGRRNAELLWNPYFAKGLSMRFRLNGNLLEIDAEYHYSTARLILKWLSNIHRARQHRRVKKQRFLHILRFVLLYPVAWYASRFHGLHVLHGGAVVVDGVGTVLSGLGGGGKSTIVFSLMSRGDAQYISDNIVLFDEEKVYAFREPLCLHPADIGILPDGGRRLKKLAGTEMRVGDVFQMPGGGVVRGCKPGVFFISCFADRTFVEKVPTSRAVSMMLAGSDLALEIHDYRLFEETLDMAFPQTTDMPDRRRQLTRLLKDVPCYILGVRKHEKMSSIIDKHIMPIVAEQKRT